MRRYRGTCDECGWLGASRNREFYADRDCTYHECPRTAHVPTPKIDIGTHIVPDPPVTHIVCSCGMALRLSSSYASMMAPLLRDKHAAFCDGQPGSHAKRKAIAAAEAREVYEKSKVA